MAVRLVAYGIQKDDQCPIEALRLHYMFGSHKVGRRQVNKTPEVYST